MDETKILNENSSKTGERDIEQVNDFTSKDYFLPKSNEPKLCSFFAKYKSCRYEQNCKFKHCSQSPILSPLKHQKNTRQHCFSDRIFTSSFSSARQRRDKQPLNQKLNSSSTLCRYFKAGNCGKGDDCLFQHSSENYGIPIIKQDTKKRRVPICHYFKKGSCHRGEECKFYHSSNVILHKDENLMLKSENYNEIPSDCEIEKKDESAEVLNTLDISSTINSQNDEFNNNRNQNLQMNYAFLSGRKLYEASYLSGDELIKLRNIEIEQLKRRYPKHIVSAELSIMITFEPSDPDWPFDLKTLDLEVHFPERYPLEECKISVAMSASNMPDMLIRYLNQSIKSWIEKRFNEVKSNNKAELIFRPFLKWFDRNLEDLFICGLRKVKIDIEAKKDGIEFVPVENLFPTANDSINSETITDDTMSESKIDASEFQNKLQLEDNKLSSTSENKLLLDNPALKQGVKILFNGLELIEGIATVSCSKLSISAQCIRCKTSCNMKCIAGKNSSSRCSKCSKVLECNFCPSIMHQFSNVAGNLHIVECQVVDLNLVESYFLVDCLNCSKQISIDGLHYGQKQKRWCTSCNDKLIFSIESVKFQAVSSSFIASKNAPVKKLEKRKDPLFKEGLPLPDYGTCKHYKKSYRWLRFPCCGRLYPCDVCHDEKENDHEMKFASRMVCGFCSKEQPFSKEKPCASCSGSMTAKAGAHWEGGKGCRNKIKMARDDKHKYAGSSKTISKKAQSTKTGKK